MPAGPLEPGDPRELGRYRLVGRLGKGGQGVVYEGFGPDGTRVAIKVLRDAADPALRRRLARELEAARRVAPFCTARVLDADLERPEPYVVSEYVAGPTLHERVRDSGPLRGGDLDRLAVGTAAALAAIHAAGVVHRDFKPSNVLLGPDGPRVVDFGIAMTLDTGTVTATLSGTPPYMAPEQFDGVHGSAATDVFAWASTMVFAATGRPPFGSETVAVVLHRIRTADPDLTGVPPSLRETLSVCLAKDPRARPSARDLMVRLVDPTVAAVTVPDVGPVPTAYLPPDWGDDHLPGATRPLDQPGGPPPGPTRPLTEFGPPSGPTRPLIEPGVPGSPPRRRARLRATALAAVAAVALGAAAVLYATQTIGDPQPGAIRQDGRASTDQQNAGAGDERPEPGTTTAPPDSPASTPSPPAGTGGVPAAFAGTWTGRIVSQDKRAETADVTLVLPSGATEGTWRVEGCEQPVTLTRIRGGNTLDLTLVQRGQCVGGDMTLTLKDPSTVDFVGQEGAGSLEYRGSLRRS